MTPAPETNREADVTRTGLEKLDAYARKWAREDAEEELDRRYAECIANGIPFDEFEDVHPGNWRTLIEVDQTR